jgi:flagellar L-ring protein precursor FlgH
MTKRLSQSLIGAVLVVVAAPAPADSLFKADKFQSFTSDTRPRRVGDVLTVMVYESASARSSADTSASRDANVAAGVQGTGKSWGAAVRSSNQLEGGGHTQRENRVLAQLTVTVKQVLPNGQLLVAGEQSLEINDEAQTISLEGVVRPQDISETNTVQSNRVAGARIRFQGQGELSARQRPSWWQRFLTVFGV